MAQIESADRTWLLDNEITEDMARRAVRMVDRLVADDADRDLILGALGLI